MTNSDREHLEEQHVWDAEHPYYAASGSFYSGTYGRRRSDGSCDGNVHHATYASWTEFKNGDPIQFSEAVITERRNAGIPEYELHLHRASDCTDCKEKRGCVYGGTLHRSDIDMNLLYRW